MNPKADFFGVFFSFNEETKPARIFWGNQNALCQRHVHVVGQCLRSTSKALPVIIDSGGGGCLHFLSGTVGQYQCSHHVKLQSLVGLGQLGVPGTDEALYWQHSEAFFIFENSWGDHVNNL